MENTQEVQVFWELITGSVDQLVESLDGLSANDLNWSPLESANSLYVLATHTMGNVEHRILTVLCDEEVERDRDAEFLAKGSSAEAIQKRWQKIRERISKCVEALPSDRLDRVKAHPGRGDATGRESLLLVARHAAEHLGHAELTRDLLRAKGSA